MGVEDHEENIKVSIQEPKNLLGEISTQKLPLISGLQLHLLASNFRK